VLDLNLPEENDYLSTVLKSRHAIADVRPDVIFAHEEFAAIFAGSMESVPTVFISAWLPQPGSIQAASLAYANSIVVLESPGIFPVPPGVTVKPCHSGPFVRDMAARPSDRERIRLDLGIPPSVDVILVATGGFSSEAKAPAAHAIFDAISRVRSGKATYTIWIAGKDTELVTELCASRSDIRVLRYSNEMDRVLAASDIVITKANRGTVMEAANMGRPTISITFGHNPIDDMLVTRLASNVTLNARATDSAVIASSIERVLNDDYLRNPRPLGITRSDDRVGALLLDELYRIAPHLSATTQEARVAAV
jgi:UDP-N-acetylglucosamine:LPS N-acetylglucosamine transferase